MKIITFLFINVLGFKLQAAFYSDVFLKYINLFDLDLNEGIECSKMKEIVDFMCGKGMIKMWEPYRHSKYYSSGDNTEKESLMKQAHNIASATFTKLVTKIIFLVNGRLVIEEDLPILKMLFRIIRCKKNTWKCINTLNEQIKIYKNCDNWDCSESHTCPVLKREDFIKFRNACNELKHYEDQPILALTKQAIFFYIKDDPKVSDEDLDNFLQQDDGLIFECSKEIKEALQNVKSFSGDMVIFEGKYVGFIHYLH
ncbi:hypothetical protein AAJ76_3100037390 [Vairimorpha ceranae]|uniref:Uncharacterized protein n=1 Tax=Vairimorpha ceranae TaxID=40302 RepID=A0A0F9ZBU3_9MICR|nr:hypothetical protein AAJ76_3100037390 [Vairimorpha ceranae]KAF5139779.1 hypothetical protein G9O61_00g020620 [Vairimorpha ceranae]KKO75134.1 hypothetical protein AAJ76_3100037390 [Vairimorpha ceranae]